MIDLPKYQLKRVGDKDQELLHHLNLEITGGFEDKKELLYIN